MKKLLSILMCVSLLSFSFYSCSDSDDDDNSGSNGIVLKVTTRYEKTDSPGQTFADKGAKVYLFFDLTPTNEYTYNLGGTYTSPKGNTFSADQNATIGDDGTISINPKYTKRPVTIIVESAFYSEVYDQGHIGNLTESTTHSIIFRP
jgi:hypothetical protein